LLKKLTIEPLIISGQPHAPKVSKEKNTFVEIRKGAGGHSSEKSGFAFPNVIQ
jgi:hypothetical protein